MAEWDAAYISSLPDSAFGYIEPGGEKDSEGKTTPRSLRHFPHHDASGSPDAAHVRNALARIPQSSVSSAGKASATAHVRKHADSMNIGQDSMPDNYEIRACEDFEFREGVSSEADPSMGTVVEQSPHLIGHAVRFGQLSGDLGGFREKVSREAFRKTLQEADVRALWNHDSRLLLGRTGNGTLALRETQNGLAYDIQMPDTSYARDLAAIIKRGDLTGMSFGFRVIRDDWNTEGETQVRTLKEVELMDVSPVTYPAYPKTDVAMRSFAQFLERQTDLGKAPRAVVASLLTAPDGAAEIVRLRRRFLDRIASL